MARRPLPAAAVAPTGDDNALLTPRQVADLFGVDAKTIARWSQLGRLPAAVWTAGGHRRFRWGDVSALLAAHPAGPVTVG